MIPRQMLLTSSKHMPQTKSHRQTSLHPLSIIWFHIHQQTEADLLHGHTSPPPSCRLLVVTSGGRSEWEITHHCMNLANGIGKAHVWMMHGEACGDSWHAVLTETPIIIDMPTSTNRVEELGTMRLDHGVQTCRAICRTCTHTCMKPCKCDSQNHEIHDLSPKPGSLIVLDGSVAALSELGAHTNATRSLGVRTAGTLGGHDHGCFRWGLHQMMIQPCCHAMRQAQQT